MNAEQQAIWLQIDALEGTKVTINRTIGGLNQAIDDLVDFTEPIADHHTIDTWEGKAASQSRSRLNYWGAGFQTCRTSFGFMVDDLIDERSRRQAQIWDLWDDWHAAADPPELPTGPPPGGSGPN